MTTVQTIIDNGFAKSAAARPDSMMSPAELIARVGQCLGEAFQVIARENPFLLGASASVSFDGTGWARPVNCLRVIEVRATVSTVSNPAITPGDPINVVPWNDQRFCEGLPSLTELGQAFVSTGQTMDPTAGDVQLVFARAATIPTQVGDTVDPLFPAPLNDFLQFDMAAYLAIKDQREKDEDTFLAQKNALLTQLVEWCRGQTYSLQQRFPIVTPPVTNDAGGRQQPTKGG